MSREYKILLKSLSLSRQHRFWLYLITFLIWMSGLSWMIIHWMEKEDEFFRSLSVNLMILHGCIAYVFVFILGSLIFHMYRAWGLGLRRIAGLLILTPIVILLISGLGLYYLGDEEMRELSSTIHFALGLLLPLFLFFHVRKV